jgi:hypothetical protein
MYEIRKIVKIFEQYSNERFEKLGRNGVRVQLDESVISRLGKIRSPTSTDDNVSQTIWLFGGIDESNKKKFFMKIVPNRQAITLKNVVEQFVHPGSILVTDGYPSYPVVACSLNMSHFVVNHSEGFTNQTGDHTNNIENLWSHLKLSISSKHGVMNSNISAFLNEFEFRKKHLDYSNKTSVDDMYKNILKRIFNKSNFDIYLLYI